MGFRERRLKESPKGSEYSQRNEEGREVNPGPPTLIVQGEE
jgi:hypothetical protein